MGELPFGADFKKSAKVGDEADKASSRWVSLKENGDRVVGLFMGPSRPKKVVWATSKYEAYDAEKHAGLRVSVKHESLMGIRQNSGWAIKKWEFSDQVRKIVEKKVAKHGQKKVFEITRSGAKGDTNTTYDFEPMTDLMPEDEDDLIALWAIHKDDLDKKPEDFNYGANVQE